MIGYNSSAMPRLEELLKHKSIDLKKIVEVTSLELAIVLGDLKIINCLKNIIYPLSQVICSLWGNGAGFSSILEDKEMNVQEIFTPHLERVIIPRHNIFRF
jgi:hypothetical protein